MIVTVSVDILPKIFCRSSQGKTAEEMRMRESVDSEDLLKTVQIDRRISSVTLFKVSF